MKSGNKKQHFQAENKVIESSHPDQNSKKPVNSDDLTGFFKSGNKSGNIFLLLLLFLTLLLFACSEKEIKPENQARTATESATLCYDPPTNFTIKKCSTGIQLNWTNSNCSFRSVVINKKSPLNDAFYLVIINSESISSFLDTDVTLGTYSYQVTTANLFDGYDRHAFTPVTSINF